MAHVLLNVVAALIVAGALFLAARYPKAFGFFAWEFGVSWILGESCSTHYLRAFKYWASVCTFGALGIGLVYLTIDGAAFEFSDGFFKFLAPLVLATGYLHAIGYFALHVYHRRRMKRTSINVAGAVYLVSARGLEVSWGRGVHIELCDSLGVVAGHCVFVVHPEFERYEEFQSKSADELLQVALRRLEASEARLVLKAYRENRESLIFPLNASQD
jgi:hypothetical protein